jgi:hypothetical protein
MVSLFLSAAIISTTMPLAHFGCAALEVCCSACLSCRTERHTMCGFSALLPKAGSFVPVTSHNSRSMALASDAYALSSFSCLASLGSDLFAASSAASALLMASS